ncbi:MAG: porin [Pseudomonadota bacterium]
MNTPKYTALCAAILAVFAGQARADDWPPVTISGFGTAALTASDTDDAEFIRPNQKAGVRTSPRTGVDSNFGIQGSAKLSDMISVTVQGLVRKNVTDNYGADMPWAFVKFKLSDDWNVRVGRTTLPIYFISDYRNVGYANTMLRPPAEVYRQVNGGATDGIDVQWQHSYGDSTVTAMGSIGRSRGPSRDGTAVTFHPVGDVLVQLENGPFTVRLGRAQATFDIVDLPGTPLATLLPQMRSVPAYAAALAQVPTENISGSFSSAGMSMDWNNIVVLSEYAMRRTDTRLVADTNSWYAMIGYRIGKFTPYYYHGEASQQSIRSFTGLPTSGPLAALTAGANAAIKVAEQSGDAFGLRWDFSKSAALKVQVDRVKPKGSAPFSFVNITNPAYSGPIKVYAAAIDFVF